jgi:hypothetical protein
MSKSYFLTAAILGLVFCCAGRVAWAQQASPEAGFPAHLVVTVEAHHGTDIPTINREDVMVYEGRERDTVTEWIPAQGDHAALELVILIDDGASSTLGNQLEDLRHFIDGQPDTAKIGVAYMQNGLAKIVQNPTSDHALAAKALRLPMGVGGINASPYFSVSDLIKRWPQTTARREVLLVTDGIDRYYGTGDLDDPYLSAAIDDALRAGVIVSAIYNPGVGHFGHSYWQTYWGQIYLSHLTEETGGEGYDMGFTGPPVSFSPYLDDLGRRLGHQYLLTFLAKPEKKAGWQRVRVKTEVSNADLVAPGRVYVSPAK